MSAEEAALYDDFTPEKISSFACSLIGNGEYYRAYVELLRLHSYYPSFLDSSVYYITRDYLFYKSKRYEDLLKENTPEISEDIFIQSHLFRIDSLIKLKRKAEAESEIVKLYQSNNAEKYSELLKKRSVYLAILSSGADGSSIKNKYPEYEELFIYSDKINESRKKPYFGALAGIIPGMGYCYAGETGTGIVSMIVIGIGSAVTYGAYSKDLNSLSVITGAITFFFYGGSIAGGYMQTLKYNSRLERTLEMRLGMELMPEKDIDEIYFKFGLNSNDCK